MADVNGYGVGNIAFGANARGAVLVHATNVECVSSVKIRITFGRSMTNDAALVSKYNYQISTATPGAVTPVISSVVAENADNPVFVELIISEMTDGATYAVEVSPAGPVDANGDPVDPNNNNGSCIGIGVAPYVVSVAGVGKNRVDVSFNENMKDNDDIRAAANYAFDNGLNVVSVLDVVENVVKLVTSDQTPGVVYTLTIAM